MQQDKILILDLGGTDHTIVARMVRALGVYSEIYPHDITPQQVRAMPGVKGLILNGGVNRVVNGTAVEVDPGLYTLGLPVMAIDHPTAKCEGCYPKMEEEKLSQVLREFVLGTCKASTNWNMQTY